MKDRLVVFVINVLCDSSIEWNYYRRVLRYSQFKDNAG